MRTWSDNYIEGILGLFAGCAISYYAYLTMVLAEILFVWKFVPEYAMAFTILLVANCLIICTFGILKRLFMLEKKEYITANIYWIALGIMFVIGCFVNFLYNLALFLLPLVVATVCIMLRNFQMMRFVTSNSRVLQTVSGIFSNLVAAILCMIFTVFAPLIVFSYMLFLVLESQILIICILFAYILVIPFMAWFEEEFVNENIFEIGFEVLWCEELETMLKSMNVSIDVFFCDEFQEAFSKLDQASAENFEEAHKEFCEDIKRIQAKLDKESK